MPSGVSTFDLNLHDDFVTRHGDLVLWRRGYKCPCGATPDANRPALSCAGCFGLGLIYDTPVQITGLVTGITRNKDLIDSGIAQPGDLVLGLAPDELNFISSNDIFRLTWAQGQPYEGDTIQRDRFSSGSLTDLLSYDVDVIEKCFTIDPSNGTLTVYGFGVDFNINGALITWVAGHGPATGKVYSIKYSAFFDWVVYYDPKDRYENAVNLGQRVLLRQRHLVTPNPVIWPPSGTGPSGGSTSATYGPVVVITQADSPYTVRPTDQYIYASSGPTADTIILLPLAVGSGRPIKVFRLDNNPHSIVIQPSGSDVILGASPGPADDIQIQLESVSYQDYASERWSKL